MSFLKYTVFQAKSYFYFSRIQKLAVNSLYGYSARMAFVLQRVAFTKLSTERKIIQLEKINDAEVRLKSFSKLCLKLLRQLGKIFIMILPYILLFIFSFWMTTTLVSYLFDIIAS